MIDGPFALTNNTMAPPDSGPIPTTLFRPGENVCAAVRAKRVAFLIDG